MISILGVGSILFIEKLLRVTIFSLFPLSRRGQSRKAWEGQPRVGSLPVANAKRQVLCTGLMGRGTAPLTSSLTLVAEDSVSGPRSDRSVMGSRTWLLSRSSTPVLCHNNFPCTRGSEGSVSYLGINFVGSWGLSSCWTIKIVFCSVSKALT